MDTAAHDVALAMAQASGRPPRERGTIKYYVCPAMTFADLGIVVDTLPDDPPPVPLDAPPGWLDSEFKGT